MSSTRPLRHSPPPIGSPNDAAGALFEAVGERKDALVSYRNAALLRTRALRLLDAMPGGGVFADDDVGLADTRGRYRVDRPMRVVEHASSFVRVAWPALSRASRPLGAVTLLLGSRDEAAATRVLDPGADVTNALAEDFRRDRALILTRSIARAVAEGAVAEALREKHGDWAGTLASLAGSAFEQPDTRSWHLLPGAVRVVRLTLPAGTHALTLQAGTDVEALAVTLPSTVLASGETRVVTTRIWRDGSAFTPPVAASARGTAAVAPPRDTTGRRISR
jgi:hypothetical protein